ncbi:hypothetical protein GCM10025794_36600 [Massilia kyonggiensis]
MTDFRHKDSKKTLEKGVQRLAGSRQAHGKETIKERREMHFVHSVIKRSGTPN